MLTIQKIYEGKQRYGEETKQFVCRKVYVSHIIVSLPTLQRETILDKNNKAVLKVTNLRLRKVIFNLMEVMEAFPCDDRKKAYVTLTFVKRVAKQRILGVYWDLEKDKSLRV